MLLETERHTSHVVLTQNRPEKLNALSYTLIDELMDRLNALERDDSVRCHAAAASDAREGPAAFVKKRPAVFLHR